MKILRRTAQFKTDLCLQIKCGKKIEKITSVLEDLVHARTLDDKYHDHPLLGQYQGTRECHVEPDWLLIYEKTVDEIILIRTGSHSDLYK